MRPALFLLLGLAAFAYLAFLTQGQHLFDNDFDWIAAARQTGWLDLLGHIFRPIPAGWGFQDRPVQVLCFKGLYGAFGFRAAPYYAFKGLLYAGVVCGIALFCLRADLGNRVAFTAAGLFALSAPVFPSALWVSDFELLAQVFILGALGCFLAAERKNLWTEDRRRFYLYQAAVFLLVLLGGRTKGSAKLVPVFLLGYLLVHRRSALRRHLPLLGLLALTVVPVFHLLHDPVPPFAPFSPDRSQGWMWKPANLETFRLLLFGNASLLFGTSGPDILHSLLGTLCPVLFWTGLAAAALLFTRRKTLRPVPPGARSAFVLSAVWLAVVIVSFSAFPRLPLSFMARYLTGALVPASILLAGLLARAVGALTESRRALATPALALVVLAHGAVNFGHTRRVRDSLGQVMIAYDRARAGLSQTVHNATVLLLGFPYSYDRPLDDGNRYLSDRDLHRSTELDPAKPLYALVQYDDDARHVHYGPPVRKILDALRALLGKGPGYRVDIRPLRTFDGLTGGLYDRWVYRSTRSFLAVLFQVRLRPTGPQKGTHP